MLFSAMLPSLGGWSSTTPGSRRAKPQETLTTKTVADNFSPRQTLLCSNRDLEGRPISAFRKYSESAYIWIIIYLGLFLSRQLDAVFFFASCPT